MSTRTEPMALAAGTSSDADDALSPAAKERVAAAITVVLSENGALTDEQIVEKYHNRAAAHPSVPRVTAQRIRTARAKLVRTGRVRDAGVVAYSHLGNRATAWTLS